MLATTADAEPADRVRRNAALRAAVLITLSFVVFAPILYYMTLHWRDDPDYSHRFLVAPLALYFAWERRPALKTSPIDPSWWGLLPLAIWSLLN